MVGPMTLAQLAMFATVIAYTREKAALLFQTETIDGQARKAGRSFYQMALIALKSGTLT
jgi:hypothetical protein